MMMHFGKPSNSRGGRVCSSGLTGNYCREGAGAPPLDLDVNMTSGVKGL